MSDLETRLTTELKTATERLAKAKALLEEIVVPEGEDAGLVWKSDRHFDHHKHFSELGDALVELWQVLSGQPEEPSES